jgi:hypothetical protein
VKCNCNVNCYRHLSRSAGKFTQQGGFVSQQLKPKINGKAQFCLVVTKYKLNIGIKTNNFTRNAAHKLNALNELCNGSSNEICNDSFFVVKITLHYNCRMQCIIIL